MRVLSDKLEKEVEDVTRDVEAYEACVQRLEGETRDVLSEADFLREKRKVSFSFHFSAYCSTFAYNVLSNKCFLIVLVLLYLD